MSFSFRGFRPSFHPPPPTGGEPTGGDPSGDGDPAESAGEDVAPASLGPHEPVSEKEWERLRAPFSVSAYAVDPKASTSDNTEAIAELRLFPESVIDRLDAVLGPSRYSFTCEELTSTPGPAMICHLQIGRARRTGVDTASSLDTARDFALTDAALAFGIGREGPRAGFVTVEVEQYYEIGDEAREALETPVEVKERRAG